MYIAFFNHKYIFNIVAPHNARKISIVTYFLTHTHRNVMIIFRRGILYFSIEYAEFIIKQVFDKRNNLNEMFVLNIRVVVVRGIAS